MKHEESAIQSALCQHLNLFGVPGLVWFAVPNGGRRNAREGGRLKAEGVKAGVADLMLIYHDKIYALEIKTRKGRLAPAQSEWLAAFDTATGGHGEGRAFVAHGLDQALDWLEARGLIRSTYSTAKDVEGSFSDAYAAIRKRVAAGGQSWKPKL